MTLHVLVPIVGAFIIGILTNIVFRKPDLCRRACCMTHQNREESRAAASRAGRRR